MRPRPSSTRRAPTKAWPHPLDRYVHEADLRHPPDRSPARHRGPLPDRRGLGRRGARHREPQHRDAGRLRQGLVPRPERGGRRLDHDIEVDIPVRPPDRLGLGAAGPRLDRDDDHQPADHPDQDRRRRASPRPSARSSGPAARSTRASSRSSTSRSARCRRTPTRSSSRPCRPTPTAPSSAGSTCSSPASKSPTTRRRSCT